MTVTGERESSGYEEYGGVSSVGHETNSIKMDNITPKPQLILGLDRPVINTALEPGNLPGVGQRMPGGCMIADINSNTGNFLNLRPCTEFYHN